MKETKLQASREGRKRRPGAGRKPSGRTVVARQVCMTPHLWSLIEEQARACGQSRSAWLAEAADCLYRRQVWHQY